MLTRLVPLCAMLTLFAMAVPAHGQTPVAPRYTSASSRDRSRSSPAERKSARIPCRAGPPGS